MDRGKKQFGRSKSYNLTPICRNFFLKWLLLRATFYQSLFSKLTGRTSWNLNRASTTAMIRHSHISFLFLVIQDGRIFYNWFHWSQVETEPVWVGIQSDRIDLIHVSLQNTITGIAFRNHTLNSKWYYTILSNEGPSTIRRGARASKERNNSQHSHRFTGFIYIALVQQQSIRRVDCEFSSGTCLVAYMRV